jgi:leader peptidase (prepilin peptidase)/N-methyltransferase
MVGAGLAYGISLGSLDGLWHLFGAILGFLSLYLVSRLYFHFRHQHGLGLGDAKLLAAAGAWLGPLYLAPVVFLGAILALAFVLILRVAGRAVSWQMTLPFGPFLSAGFLICWCINLGGWSLVS